MNDNEPRPSQLELPDAPDTDAGPPSLEANAQPTNDPAVAFHNRVAALKQTGDNGANWFYWVAGLSLVNTGINLFGGGIYFVVGLGVTLIVDVFTMEAVNQEPEIAVAARAISIGFTLFVAVVLCGFGWLSRKRILPIFAVGMVLYVLDGLLFVLFQDWMSVAFHAFALYSMIGGFMAYRQLNILQREIARAST
ncbi:MAG: hypothetical protein HUU46_03135 [Candidatus Hydrogenedentes bacterium]|nr:hypothetical protein [Candidatus Hydrogenedentota bacterium]